MRVDGSKGGGLEMVQDDLYRLSALFRAGLEHQFKGNPKEALKSFDAVIRLNPEMAAAHCNRGIVLQALGKVDEALRSYDRAIQIDSHNADAYYNRGFALTLMGRLDEALQSYDRAIQLKPGHIAAHANRGGVLRELKQPEAALTSFDTVIALDPRVAAAHNQRGNALRDLDRLEEAIQSFERAIKLQPNFAEAYYNRGTALLALEHPYEAVQSFDRAILLQPAVAEAYHQKGKALYDLGRLQEALGCFDRALSLKHDFVEAHNDRGNVLYDLKRPDEALCSYERAVTLKRDFAEAHSNRGNALHALNRLDEALESHDRAVALRPDFARGHSNRAYTLRELGRVHEALASYCRAIEFQPVLPAVNSHRSAPTTAEQRLDETNHSALKRVTDHVSNMLGKSMCLLQTGDFDQGWPLYEWRKKKPGRTDYREYPQPAWTGIESLEDKTLLIYAEQGLGDTIQFCRYAQLVQKTGARVVLAVQDSLVRLLRSIGPGIDVVGLTESPTAFDYHIALLSLPLALGTGRANCPSSVPYLHADPERVVSWRERIGTDGFRIGICWQGNKNSEIDAGRSFSVSHFERLAKLRNVRLISLQKNDGIEQLPDFPSDLVIETLGEDFDAADAFVDSAAVMECLDLVITSDTAVAHLAGALGRPTWVALKYVPDWRWLLDRSDSPWYPTMRLFRQPRRDDWPGAFAAMESQLVQFVQERS